MKKSFEGAAIAHGLYSCCGFDSKNRHFNRSFRTKKAAQKFLAAMRRGDDTVERY